MNRCLFDSGMDEDSQYNMFFLYWSLKEAFIKAVGLGLGYDLASIEFTVYPTHDLAEVGKRKIDGGYATVALHGVLREDWK
jgi:phosphopantetheinyl transferase